MISEGVYDYFMFKQIITWYACFEEKVRENVDPNELIERIENCPHG
jgi:hypothetical protein